MPIKLEINQFSEDLDDFQMTLRSIDMESVKQRTLKRAAEEMSEMVRQAVFESSIKSPAKKISEYEAGDPPPLATGDAWIVQQDGDGYTVRPHPDVRQRAIVLNNGYPGTITPTDSEVLKFTVDGVPHFATEVDGPEATGYWQVAIQRMRNSGKLGDIAQQELEFEFEEAT